MQITTDWATGVRLSTELGMSPVEVAQDFGVPEDYVRFVGDDTGFTPMGVVDVDGYLEAKMTSIKGVRRRAELAIAIKEAAALDLEVHELAVQFEVSVAFVVRCMRLEAIPYGWLIDPVSDAADAKALASLAKEQTARLARQEREAAKRDAEAEAMREANAKAVAKAEARREKLRAKHKAHGEFIGEAIAQHILQSQEERDAIKAAAECRKQRLREAQREAEWLKELHGVLALFDSHGYPKAK